MFLYVEFPGLAEACALGATMDSKSLPAALTGFWNTWMGVRPVHLWSCALLTEALEVVTWWYPSRPGKGSWSWGCSLPVRHQIPGWIMMPGISGPGGDPHPLPPRAGCGTAPPVQSPPPREERAIQSTCWGPNSVQGRPHHTAKGSG